mmetsp:Transcript_130344/g.325145  ORF Transcript_130344/g.325145 Transcript_130344/m.325145 type:complete len:220 (-) Transcript_130344:161-820(-)
MLPRLSTPWRGVDRLCAHLVLCCERATTRHQGVCDDSCSPHVHLESVAPIIELRGPIHLCAAAVPQPLVGPDFNSKAEVAEANATLWMFQVCTIQQIVICLHVAVDDAMLMEPFEALEHLAAQLLDCRYRYLALGLLVKLHTANHVPTTIEIEHHVNDVWVDAYIMQLHNARVGHLPENAHFSVDNCQGDVALIDPLRCELLPADLACAREDNAERASS